MKDIHDHKQSKINGYPSYSFRGREETGDKGLALAGHTQPMNHQQPAKKN